MYTLWVDDIASEFVDGVKIYKENFAPIEYTRSQPQVFGYFSCNRLQYGVPTMARTIVYVYVTSYNYDDEDTSVFRCYAWIVKPRSIRYLVKTFLYQWDWSGFRYGVCPQGSF